jgi:hypothetical protein
LRMLQEKVGVSKAAVFNVEHNIEAMFYARVSAYPFIPTHAQMEEAQSKGFKVFVYDSPEVPPDIRNDAQVVMLKPLQ